jgi:hypothetical protein
VRVQCIGYPHGLLQSNMTGRVGWLLAWHACILQCCQTTAVLLGQRLLVAGSSDGCWTPVLGAPVFALWLKGLDPRAHAQCVVV